MKKHRMPGGTKMYQLSVLQNQWLILALFGGIVLMIGSGFNVSDDVAAENRVV